jgi:hypothetical protein
LSGAAAQAQGAAGQARAVASVFEAARSAVVHPLEVAANRNVFVQLIRSNLLGLNAPAIMAAEALYEAMWAAGVSAMLGYYEGASSAAAQLPLPANLQQFLNNLPNWATATRATPTWVAATPAAATSVAETRAAPTWVAATSATRMSAAETTATTTSASGTAAPKHRLRQ